MRILGPGVCVNLVKGMLGIVWRPVGGSLVGVSLGGKVVVVSIGLAWLRRMFASRGGSLGKEMSALLKGEGSPALARSMSLSEKELAKDLISPPVEDVALAWWYEAKVIELAALHFFRGEIEELFCKAHRRGVREKVEGVRDWLSEHLDEKFELEKVAGTLGCSGAHLSRVFSQAMGMTISQYLRGIRMDHAAKLMEAGVCNVTEAAMEVGYSSLSHFTKAFREEKGVTPSQFLKDLGDRDQ